MTKVSDDGFFWINSTDDDGSATGGDSDEGYQVSVTRLLYTNQSLLSFCCFSHAVSLLHFDISCLFSSYLSNQESGYYCSLSAVISVSTRPLRLLRREMFNSGVDTSSLHLSLSGTVCAFHQGEIYRLSPVHEVHHLMKVIL